MKDAFLFFYFLLSLFSSFGQNTDSDNDGGQVLDSLYREDQFYVGFTFNLLDNRPSGVNQSGFSGGLHMGFIRDMPIVKKRNIAIGLGIGYSANTYGQDLFIGEKEGSEVNVFRSLSNEDYKSNRFVSHLIEAPLEFRWRTSIPETHKFWRIYTGVRVGYLYYFKSKYESSEMMLEQSGIDGLDRWRVGVTFTFGWNTFNFHFYYGLNTLFDNNARMDTGELVGLRVIKIGLMFYLL